MPKPGPANLKTRILWPGGETILSLLLIAGGMMGSAGSGAYQVSRKSLSARRPLELQGLEVQENLGAFVDKTLRFQEETGAFVSLNKYFQENRPVLLSIVYYDCPNLCNLHLNGLSEALHELPGDFKRQMEWVAVSMDHRETPALAQRKKNKYLEKYAFPGDRMHFLTGTREDILSLSRQVGFRFRWDKSQKIYAHIPVAYVLTPQAQIARYLYGVQFTPQTVKLSLIEASHNLIGRLVDRVILFCFQFDPQKGRYSWYAYNIMRAGGVLTVLLLLIFLIPVWVKEYIRIK